MSNRETAAAILPCSQISTSQISDMFALHQVYFENVSFDKFKSDFSKKQWCIVICNLEQRIVGYSTIELIFRTINNKSQLILFSGDTLVSKEYRSSNALIPLFVQFSEYLERIYPTHERYWLLITKGYRTYRLLPTNYRVFYPTFRIETPPEIQNIIDIICLEKFGSRYDAQAGILQSDNQHDFLKPEFAEIPTGREHNPDVKFFLNINTGFRLGDELICLTPLAVSNLLPSSCRRYLNKRWNPIEA